MLLRLTRTSCRGSISSWTCSIPFSSRRTLSTSGSTTGTNINVRPEVYDIVCVGGGPAGLSLLSALRSCPRTANLKIALVEGQDLSKNQPLIASSELYSNRCSSLTPGSVKFLKDIGVWQHATSDRVQPYHSMHVWDGVSGSCINFDPADLANSSFIRNGSSINFDPADLTNSSSTRKQEHVVAYMTENSNTVSALLSHLSTTPPIDTFDKTRVHNIDLGQETDDMDLSNWPIVSLSNSRTLAARLLVGADGANSPVRTFAGIPSRGWDYNRHGVVATLQLSESTTPHKTAYQRFLPTGPVAMLPLPNNTASLVWSTTPENAALLKTLGPDDFLAMVNAAFRLLPVDLAYMHTISSGQADEFEWRQRNTAFEAGKMPQLARRVQDGSVASFPLKMRHADTYVGHRVALLGDAAHTIHPLAGQGLNQGLGDAQSLAKHIGNAVAVGKDIGSNWALDPYNAEQWSKNNAMLGAVDKLHKLYSAGSGPIVWARTLGLQAVDKLPFVKGFFMKQATGL